MKVLIACEYSGRVRDAFIRMGHDAISCDLLPTDAPGPHFQGDVREMLAQEWDLIIAHPPCTYLTNAGVRWLYNADKSRNEPRWNDLQEGCDFFNLFLDHPCQRIAIENPIPHSHAAKLLRREYDQTIQPYQFGHMETKRTCLWLKGLSPLVATDDVEAAMRLLPKSESNKVHYASPGKDRWKMRSTTFQGIADAMAAQWGGIALKVAA
jgi:hypothetical protein